MNSSVSSDPVRLHRLLTCCHFPQRRFTFSFQHGIPFLPDYFVCSPYAPAVLHSAFLTSYLDLKLLFTEFPAFSLLDLFFDSLSFISNKENKEEALDIFIDNCSVQDKSSFKRSSSGRMKPLCVESTVD